MISIRPGRLRTAFKIAAGTAAVSALVGAVWAFLAPPERLLVVSEGRGAPLTGESLHQFDAVAIFLWLALIVGILSAVLAWLARSSRGLYAFVGLFVGSVVGAGLMALAGAGVARLRFPAFDNPAVGEIVARAPAIGTLLVLLFQPLAACAVTLVLAVLNPYDDLGVGDQPERDPAEAAAPTEAPPMGV